MLFVFFRIWPMVWIDKTLIPRLGSCRAFEAALKLQFGPSTRWSHCMEKNPGRFSSKTFISFRLKKERHEHLGWRGWSKWSGNINSEVNYSFKQWLFKWSLLVNSKLPHDIGVCHKTVGNSAYGEYYVGGGKKTLTFCIRTAIKSQTVSCKC